MGNKEIRVRALQLGEHIDVKGLEREDAFSSTPLAFRTGGGGMAVLFKSGAAVFFDMNPVDEEGLIRSLDPRIVSPLQERETEAVRLLVKPDEEEGVSTVNGLQIKTADPDRLLLVAEALAMSVTLAYDERRIALAFDRIDGVAQTLQQRRLLGPPRRRVRPAPARPGNRAQARSDPRHRGDHHRPHGHAHEPPARGLHHCAHRVRDRPQPLRPLLEVKSQGSEARLSLFAAGLRTGSGTDVAPSPTAAMSADGRQPL
jgi:hypothetical protein